MNLFTKENDFKLVIERLEKFSTNELLLNNEFTSTFARVLRYILVLESDGDNDIEIKNGENIELLVIAFFNKVFGTNAKVVVLEGSQETDPSKASSFYRLQGNSLRIASDRKIIDSSSKQLAKKEKTADFLIILKTGHYFCGITS